MLKSSIVAWGVEAWTSCQLYGGAVLGYYANRTGRGMSGLACLCPEGKGSDE